MVQATFTRLRYEPGQPWGVRVAAKDKPKPGMTVHVTTRNGREQDVELGAQVGTAGEDLLFTKAGGNSEAQESLTVTLAKTIADLEARVAKLEAAGKRGRRS